jgi:acid phosphatase
MFNKQTLAAFIGSMSLASAATIPASDDMPSLAEIEAAAATVKPYSPVSNVKGLVFDNFHQIWFENQVSQFHQFSM